MYALSEDSLEQAGNSALPCWALLWLRALPRRSTQGTQSLKVCKGR